MLKNITVLHEEINGKSYDFYCQPDSPLDDAIEANSRFNAFMLGKRVQQQQTQQAASAPIEVVAEPNTTQPTD